MKSASIASRRMILKLPKAIWLIALVLLTRIAFLILFGHTLSLNTSGYDTYALNLLAGHGYTRFADLHPDTDLPPLYSFVLVAIYLIAGHSAIAVAVVQIGFEIGIVLLVNRIGRLIFGSAVGFLAALFVALYPYQLFQDLTVNDTAVFILLLCGAVYCATCALHRTEWNRRQVGDWILCGICIGLGALTKTLIVLTIPILVLGAWTHIGFKHAVYAGAVVTLFTGLVITPWSIRNTIVNGSFTLISTNDGSNFYQANNRCAIQYMESGWDVQWAVYAGCLDSPPAGLTDLQVDHWLMQRGISFLKDNPQSWLRLVADKFLVLWSPDITPTGLPPMLHLSNSDPVEQYNTPLFQIARILHLLYFTPLLVLGVLGLFLSLRRRQAVTPILAGLCAITGAYLVFHPSTRYRAPADPLLFILSAYTLVIIWSWIRQPHQSAAG